MRKFGKNLYYILILLTFSCQQKENNSALTVQIKRLDYPSASSVEYYNGKLYVMGDDATHLLVLDTNFNFIDSIPIVLYSGKRIPKEIKPDLEASTIYSDSNETSLFLFGSGALDPYRNAGWKYNLQSNTKDYVYLQPLYARIKATGVEQINIEGSVFLTDRLVLANRGHKGYPYNQLILIGENYLKGDSSYNISIIPFKIQKDTALFKGISGLTYAKQNDQLLMTVSTEDTRSAYEDGLIGKSYLWIINNILTKLNATSLKADRIIDLEEIDSRFKGQKIESAAVISETSDLIHLALVADNDDGSSTIFKMSIKKD